MDSAKKLQIAAYGLSSILDTTFSFVIDYGHFFGENFSFHPSRAPVAQVFPDSAFGMGIAAFTCP
jgi:hypothetical protein